MENKLTKHICPAVALLTPEYRHCAAVIKSFSDIDKQTKQKLTRLGICEGCPISVSKHANTDPVIFTVNNSHIALRHSEAALLMVECQ